MQQRCAAACAPPVCRGICDCLGMKADTWWRRSAARASAVAVHPTRPEFAIHMAGNEGGSHVLVCGDTSAVPKQLWHLPGVQASAAGSLVYSWDVYSGGKAKPFLLAPGGPLVCLALASLRVRGRAGIGCGAACRLLSACRATHAHTHARVHTCTQTWQEDTHVRGTQSACRQEGGEKDIAACVCAPDARRNAPHAQALCTTRR